MKFALVSDLDQSALADTGIGSASQCVKLFKTEQDAVAYAENLIRENTTDDEKRVSPQVLDDFQDTLGALEWFHIVPVVE